MEFGESCRAAAARELHEEVGLTASRLHPCGLHEFVGEGHHLLVVILEAAECVGDPRAGGDAADVRWWTEGELQDELQTEALLRDARRALTRSHLLQ